MNIVSLTAGTVFVNSGAYSLAGGRTQSSMTWLDGGTGQNIRIGIGNTEVSPPVDTVQELGIISNNYAAQFGGSSAGIIVQTTKSGTNQFHWSLYEFLRNNAFDAPGYFAPVGANGSKDPTGTSLQHLRWNSGWAHPQGQDLFLFRIRRNETAQRLHNCSNRSNAVGA